MLYHLTDYSLIKIDGIDAEKYLQGQLTCDVAKLGAGQSTLTAHCDPKGKMVSIFRLIRQDAQCFYVLIPQSLLASALEALKKYAVFSKVSFTPLDETQIIGNQGGSQTGDLQVAFADGRQIVIHFAPKALDLEADATPWRLAALLAGEPRLYPQTQGEFIPQALNLQALEQAISFQKGCYIGQETVARAKYRGVNKRAMYVLVGESDTLPEIGSELEMQLDSHWRKTGKIVDAINDQGKLYLQAVLSNQLEADSRFRLPNSDTALSLHALPYELA